MRANTPASLTFASWMALLASIALHASGCAPSGAKHSAATVSVSGTLDLQAAFSAGCYSSADHAPTAAEIAVGATVLGVAGTAAFPDFMASTVFRDQSTTQLTLREESTSHAGGDLPTGNRDVPSIATDDEGYWTSAAGCTGAGGTANTCVSQITYVNRSGFVDCGKTQATLALRIADCAAQNGSEATWDGAIRGNAGQGTWKLVTRASAAKEVWQDQRTGLLWSSKIAPTSDSWCRASGNAEAADPGAFCSSTTHQPEYPVAESACAEGGALVQVPGWCSNGQAHSSAAGCTGAGGTWTANTDDWGTGTYSDAKGGMGAGSTPAVRWRLPTAYDYKLADVNGLRLVLPDSTAVYEWTASVSSSNRGSAHEFHGGAGTLLAGTRSSFAPFRCVGR
jgi:hypothetical protein